jgi:hypothetical protein
MSLLEKIRGTVGVGVEMVRAERVGLLSVSTTFVGENVGSGVGKSFLIGVEVGNNFTGAAEAIPIPTAIWQATVPNKKRQ